jgi:gag-polypeptide of LTR copia-type
MRWRTDEAIVKHMIASSVSNAIFNQIKGKRNKDVLDALKALFERHATRGLVDLEQRLKLTRCREDDDTREHFDKLANMREQLSTMDKSRLDAKYASILMPSYQSLLSAIAASAEMSGTFATSAIVIKLVTDEYNQRTLE